MGKIAIAVPQLLMTYRKMVLDHREETHLSYIQPKFDGCVPPRLGSGTCATCRTQKSRAFFIRFHFCHNMAPYMANLSLLHSVKFNWLLKSCPKPNISFLVWPKWVWTRALAPFCQNWPPDCVSKQYRNTRQCCQSSNLAELWITAEMEVVGIMSLNWGRRYMVRPFMISQNHFVKT